MLSPRTLRVAVIGSGPYDVQRPMGRFIDSCDVVMRFNAYITKRHEPYVGKKTDIWCFLANVNRSFQRQFEPVGEIWTVRHFNYNFTFPIHELAKACHATHYDIDQQIIEDVKSELGHSFPSTGIIGLAAAIHQYRKYSGPIFIQGMGALFTGTKLHYYSSEQVRSNVRHSATKERALLERWRNRDLIYWVENDKNYFPMA